MKKTLRITVIIIGFIVFVVMMARLTLDRGTTSPSVSPTQPTITQPLKVVPNTPTAVSGKSPANKALAEKFSVNGAVQAAALANSRLSESILLPEQQMRQIVETAVAPTVQHKVEKNYLKAALPIARALGYKSPGEAQSNANYYVVTQKYWVQSFGKQTTVWLYNITHATTPPDQRTINDYAVTHPGQNPQGQDYYVPSITIVQMRWLNRHWLWTGTQDPPADKVPPQEGHPTFQQAVDAYLPYIRSFKNYASLH